MSTVGAPEAAPPREASLDMAIRGQEDLAYRIDRLLINIDKKGKQNITVPFLETRLKQLDDYWRVFDETHRAIVQHRAAAGTDYYKSDTFEVTEDRYADTRAAILARIAEMEPKKAVDATSACHRACSADDPEVTFPAIKLPKFSGDLMEWDAFREEFMSTVDSSKRLTAVRKLTYLKSCLEGEASGMLARLPVREEHYAKAWEILEKRYSNLHFRTCAYLRRVFQCPPATKTHYLELKRLLDEFRQVRVSLDTLGHPVDAWDVWFVCLLSDRLDQQTRLEWESSFLSTTSCPAWSTLEEFLERRIHILRVTTDARGSAPSAPKEFK